MQTRSITPLLAIGFLTLSLGVAGKHALLPLGSTPFTQVDLRDVAVPDGTADRAASSPVRFAAQFHNQINSVTKSVIETKPEAVSREVTLAEGESFADMLKDTDVVAEDAAAVANVLNRIYDHHRLKAGQDITLSLTRQGTEETLNKITFQPETTKEIIIARGADGTFAGQVNTTPILRERIAAHAEIRSTLFEAGEREGVPHSIMAAIIRAYSHEVDFQRDIHPGDKFEVLYDQPTSKDGKPAGQGIILYAALEIDGEVKPLYRVTFADGGVDYFDARGKSIKRALLRTPVDGAHVTSGFGMRVHPLLGFTKMHQGIDFGAAIGTPIFAAGSGTVEEIGVKGGYGRYIKLRHNNKIETAYAHMSRYGRSMYQGAHVNQGDVIGFVGQSGRATGAHLHFEVHVDGRPVNPLSVNLPTGRVLEGQALVQFKHGQNQIRSEFSNLLAKDTAPEAIKASSTTVAFPTTPSNSCGLRHSC